MSDCPLKLIVDEQRERQRFLAMATDTDNYPFLAKCWREFLERAAREAEEAKGEAGGTESSR